MDMMGCPDLLITIEAAVRDSYVVLKDSRMFISSRTVVSSVDNSSVSSSRSAVTSCETERGKRHVYLKRIERKFQDPRVRLKALVFAYICCTGAKKASFNEG